MLPTLASLNKSQKAAYSYMQGAVSRGIGANEALRQYQAIGGSIRRTSGLDLYRYISGIDKAGFTISSVRKDYYPSLRTLPESRTDIRRDYSFNVKLDMKNSVTGESFIKNITVTSDRQLRIFEIEDAAHDAFYDPESGREGTNVEITGTTIIEARRKADIFAAQED